MWLETGRVYVLTLQVDGLANGTDWLPTAVAGTYPVTVLGQGPDRPSRESITADVVVRWTGPAASVDTGGAISSAEIPTIGAATATLVGVAEQAEALPSTSTVWLDLGASVVLLGFVSYMVYRGTKRRKRAS